MSGNFWLEECKKEDLMSLQQLANANGDDNVMGLTYEGGRCGTGTLISGVPIDFTEIAEMGTAGISPIIFTGTETFTIANGDGDVTACTTTNGCSTVIRNATTCTTTNGCSTVTIAGINPEDVVDGTFETKGHVTVSGNHPDISQEATRKFTPSQYDGYNITEEWMTKDIKQDLQEKIVVWTEGLAKEKAVNFCDYAAKIRRMIREDLEQSEAQHLVNDFFVHFDTKNNKLGIRTGFRRTTWSDQITFDVVL